MPHSPDPRALLDTIAGLAEDIARTCPEAADKAQRITSLVKDVGCAMIDRDQVKDAIDAQTADADLSDAQIENATDAVMRAMRDEP